MAPPRAGLTLVEVLAASVVLTVGVLALVGSWAHTGRMIGWGRQSTVAAAAAAARLAELRRVAGATVPACSSPDWRDGSDSTHGLVQHWRIVNQTGPARRIEVVVRTRMPTGWWSDTVAGGVLCWP